MGIEHCRMKSTTGRLTSLVFVAIPLFVTACGGSSSPSAPGTGSGGSGSCTSVGVLGAAKGTINATISGAAFLGGVPTGQSIYTPIPATAFTAAQDFITISGICGDNTSILLLARATIGTTSIGVDGSGNPLRDPQTQQPLVHKVVLQLRTGGVAAGTWNTDLLGGTGTVTISSVSPAAASGSFSVTMVPQSGTPASGNKSVSGSFSVTF
jgi:hypothetical protein